MSAYYNEHDAGAAEWLRELMKSGLIAPGDVDERSIEDVVPSELMGYTQCHFFAGIGVWSYALRLAGWPDDREVWTGSCPCQPFSAAGKGAGFADERHLWPALHHLIRVCRPDTFFGEQVASRDGLGWLDLVQPDLEGEAYAFRAVDLCVAGFGAPHIRQRLWFVADDLNPRPQDGRPGRNGPGERRRDAALRSQAEESSSVDQLAQSGHKPLRGSAGRGEKAGRRSRAEIAGPGWSGKLEVSNVRRFGAWTGDQSKRAQRESWDGFAEQRSELGELEDADGGNSGSGDLQRSGQHGLQQVIGRAVPIERPGPTNGVWADADWLFCRDEWWRPVEAGTFPLAHGAPGRMGRLRGYGNAISPWPAKALIEARLAEDCAGGLNGA